MPQSKTPPEEFNISGKIGELIPRSDTPEWPMYSYSRPSWILWGAIAKGLYMNGWSEKSIRAWLQSQRTRSALDYDLGQKLEQLGLEYSQEVDGLFPKGKGF